MTIIYDSYEDEPKDTFEPLTSDDYCSFYDYEMSSFTDDIPFFKERLKVSDTILELGVGSGRLASALNRSGYTVFGIDISPSMLKIARKKHNLNLACMDIRQLCFLNKFDQILAPYNLLNLLCDKNTINQCLRQSWNALTSTGTFSANVFTISKQSELSQNNKSFQFQIIKYDDGKIIKEIVRHYIPGKNIVQVEERYRVRPNDKNNKDYNNIFQIAAFSLKEWHNIFRQNGFHILTQYGDYDLSPVDESSSQLLISLRK